jgi:hypothetical protein
MMSPNVLDTYSLFTEFHVYLCAAAAANNNNNNIIINIPSFRRGT